MNSQATLPAARNWLVTSNLLDEALLEQAILSAQKRNLSLVKYLVEQNILDSKLVAMAASRQFRLPIMDLDAMDPALLPLTVIKQDLLRKHQVVPLHKGENSLFLGMSDPANQDALDEIKFHTSCRIEPVVVEQDKLSAVVQELLDQDCSIKPGDISEHLDFNSLEIENSNDDPEADQSDSIDETPVMRFVNKMLMDSIRLGVSDIHIETFEKFARIRFREDGMLREIARPPLTVTRKIGSRLKVMAKLDIAEKRLPQDGRFRLKFTRSRSIDFRVSTLPTLWGEKTVLRILDFQQQKLDLDAMGFTNEQKQQYTEALQQQQGLVLVTGPTGSGKSMTLYAGLKLLNTQERNIATAEDPVEIQMQGINQLAVNADIGLNFAEALRAFLRQDPDVIMVGEIRDLETAEIAMRAAQTGHLVLSTLHTNSAPETLSRLMQMGIPAYQIASSLSLVVAQRLARRLCNHCKKPVELPHKVLIQEGFTSEEAQTARIQIPAGCEFCHSGYKGRLGIIETVPITTALSHVIMNGGNSMQIAEFAEKAGFNSLRRSALEKAAQGLISLAEVNRITDIQDTNSEKNTETNPVFILNGNE